MLTCCHFPARRTKAFRAKDGSPTSEYIRPEETTPDPVQATVLTAGLLYIVAALLVDILYAYVNPRIRYE